MEGDSVIPKIVARTDTEEELAEFLRHMDEWHVGPAVDVESLHGEWITTLVLPVEDPRRLLVLAYLEERPTAWKVDIASGGCESGPITPAT